MQVDIYEFIEKVSSDLDAGQVSTEQIRMMISELCEMSRSDERALESHLVRLYQHMLKYKYQRDHQTSSWIKTIRTQSNEINVFRKDKTLIRIVLSDIDSIYDRAKKYASVETNFPLNAFPDNLPEEWLVFENISDITFIESFLKENAFSYEARKYLYLV